MAALAKIREVPHAVLYEDPATKTKCVFLKDVRLSYAFVGTPGEDESESGEKKKSWRAVLMLPKETHGQAKDLFKSVIEELLVKNETTVPKANWCLTDGDSDKYEDEKYKTYRGHFLISVKDGSHRPTARDVAGRVIEGDNAIERIDEMFYSGRYANVMTRPWYFNGKTRNSPKSFPKRILAGFQSLNLSTKKGDPFGTGRIDDADVYGQVGGDAGAGNGIADDEDGI